MPKNKIRSRTVDHWTEETSCRYCGLPLIQGDKVYYLDEAGPVFCSPGCVHAEEVWQLQKKAERIKSQ